MADRETFDLGEFAKKPRPKAGRRFAADKSDEVRGDQILLGAPLVIDKNNVDKLDF